MALSYTLGFTSPIGDALKKSEEDGGIGLSDSQQSLFGALVNVGAMFGAVLGSVIMDNIGRRWWVSYIQMQLVFCEAECPLRLFQSPQDYHSCVLTWRWWMDSDLFCKGKHSVCNTLAMLVDWCLRPIYSANDLYVDKLAPFPFV